MAEAQEYCREKTRGAVDPAALFKSGAPRYSITPASRRLFPRSERQGDRMQFLKGNNKAVDNKHG